MSDELANLLESNRPAAVAAFLGFNAPYTSNSMLEIAVAFDELSREARVPARDVITCWRLRDWALTCAEVMDTRKLEPLANIGPFQTSRYRKGDKVRLRAGAAVRSTNRRLCRTLNCTYSVTVFDINAGYIDQAGQHKDIRNPEVTWVGSGGYWCWTDINNVIFATRGQEDRAA